jgi:hypothetical protein
MSARLTLLSLATILFLCSCSAPSDRCCEPCEPKLCKVPPLIGLTHAQVTTTLISAGFIIHPTCRDEFGNDCDNGSGHCGDDWVVDKAEPDSGTYDCTTVIDLVFVAPKIPKPIIRTDTRVSRAN